MDCAVAYYRVSTRQQQRSGLGIEAQRAAVERFAETEKLKIVAEYVEAETGKARMRSTDARNMLPILRTLRAEGAITTGAVTRSLNARKIPTARASRWYVSSVANLLVRAQKLEAT